MVESGMAEHSYQVAPGEFVVSQHGVWVEGAYTTPEAAIMAASLDPDKLSSLWRSKCPAALTLRDVKDAGG